MAPAEALLAMVGLPDAKLGETVLAWVKLKSGEQSTPEEIRDFCRGRIAYFGEQEIRERGLEEVARQAKA